MQVKPKKALGQHFLTDLTVAKRIADTLDGFAGLPVVEVGPGMGVLTQFLLEKDFPRQKILCDRKLSVQYIVTDIFPCA